MSNIMPVSQAYISPLTPVSEQSSAGFARTTWNRWKKIARAIGVVQTRILMVIFYFIVVLPLGLVLRSSGDPLRLRPRPGSNWSPHREGETNLEAARRQF